MSVPLVSVIVPCYNQGEFVAEAVESVLAQTVQDYEILILNDGSTDLVTPAVLGQAMWPRTQIFHTANRGLAGARNFLISQSKGKYVCALDADDSLAPRYLEATLEAFRQDPGLSFVGTRLQMFGAETRITPAQLTCDLPTLLVDCPLSPATLVRRAAVVDEGGYDHHIPGNEDWDLWISLLERGHRGLILPEVLFNYRRRPGSLCDVCTRGEVYLEHARYLLRKHRESYRRHLPHVLASKQAGMQERQAAIDRLTREIESGRTAGNGARASVGSYGKGAHDVDTLRDEYARAVAEIAALRESLSWRVTAPLRLVYELLGGPHGAVARAGTEQPEVCREPISLPVTQVPPFPELGAETDVEGLLMPYETVFVQQRERLAELHEGLRKGEPWHHAPEPFPAGSEAIEWGELRRTTPISAVWGTDRGRPLDRYYIEGFLERHRQDIKGAVLEVKDPAYTQRFGEHHVRTSDVLDVDATNGRATLIADLAGTEGIGCRRFDCIILTQTLGLIFDVRAALFNVATALKPDGVLLCTLPASGRISYEPPGLDGDYWRFTQASISRLFGAVFPPDAVTIRGYGNVLARAAFEYGLADDELTRQELDVYDPYFPVIYGIRAVRTWT